MQTEMIPIDKLKHAEYNPRKITPEDFEQIKTSIERFGLVQPLVVNQAPGREGVIIGGNQRFEVAKKLGMTEVPVTWVDIPDLGLEKELNVRLNRNQADWDWDILSKEFTIEGLADWGFSSKEINLNFDVPEKEESQNIPEPPKDPRSKFGMLYRLGRHKILCGDATHTKDVEFLMGGGKADLVVTSPPYNVGKKYGKDFDDQKSMDDYLNFVRRTMFNIKLILDQGRFLCWNIGPSPKCNLVGQLNIISDSDFDFYRMIVWDKCGVPLPTWFNTQKNPLSRNYHPNWRFEVILLFSNGYPIEGSPIIPDEFYSSDIWKVSASNANKDIDDTPRDARNDERSKVHPAAFPIKIPLGSIKHLSAEFETVFDPFTGTGTSLIACENTNRNFYGLEINPAYCDVIIKRYCNFTGANEDEIFNSAVTQAEK